MNAPLSRAMADRAFAPPQRPAAWDVNELTGRARRLSLEPGLHALTVAPISASSPVAGLALPATCISGSGEIEITAPDGPARDWVGAEGGVAIVKVRERPVEVLVTTYGVGDSAAPPAIAVRRLAPQDAAPAKPEMPEGSGIAARILLHIARLGDQTFQDGHWAGDPGGRLPIEGLAISFTERLSADDVEYMAVAVNGAHTAWVSGPGSPACAATGWRSRGSRCGPRRPCAIGSRSSTKAPTRRGR